MQLDYSQNPAVAYAGMMADTGQKHVISCVNPNTVIPFGRLVARDASDAKVKLPTSAAEVTACRGIAIQDFSSEQVNDGLEAGYKLKSSVSVMRQGRVWVKVEEAVVQGDNVYARWNDGNTGNVSKGAFRKSVDQVSAADTATLVPSAKYVTSASAGGFAIIEINLP